MKKMILAALALTLLLSTSAIASDFCEIPDWLDEGKSYLMILGQGQKANGKVLDIDKSSCWIVVEDRSQAMRTNGGPGFKVNVNLRQVISAIEQN